MSNSQILKWCRILRFSDGVGFSDGRGGLHRARGAPWCRILRFPDGVGFSDSRMVSISVITEIVPFLRSQAGSHRKNGTICVDKHNYRNRTILTVTGRLSP